MASVALDVINEGVLVHGADGQILYANRAAAHLLGVPRGALRSPGSFSPAWRPISERGAPLAPDDRPVAHALRTGEAQRDMTIGIRHADGRVVWLKVNVQPVGDSVVTSMRDVTEVRRLEEQAASPAAGRRAGNGKPSPGALSRRERDVVELLARGLTGEQVAERLGIAPATVRVHIRNAAGKLGASTRTQAVAIAVARGEVATS